MISKGLSVLSGNILKVECRSVQILNVLQKRKAPGTHNMPNELLFHSSNHSPHTFL